LNSGTPSILSESSRVVAFSVTAFGYLKNCCANPETRLFANTPRDI
jgi:hypothetical protein